MNRWGAVTLAIAIAATPARAQEPDPAPEPEGPVVPIDEIRELYMRGDYAGVRRRLLEAYEVSPQPSLLFALGQVELNLGNYQAAITHYEQFIATGPSEEQIALAQQAIGAARMRLAQPKRVETPPPVERPRVPPRRWYTEDTGLVALGGASLAVGAGLFVYGRRLAHDRSGTLSQYDARVDQARTTQWIGSGIAAAGVLVIGATILRWRLRPDGDERVSASVTGDSAQLVVSGRW